MAVNTEPPPQRASRKRDGTNWPSERCCACDKELSDEEALIVCDYDPVDFVDGPRILKGYEIRCGRCIALLPNCPVCSGLMIECTTCGAHYCRRHTVTVKHRASEPTVPVAASLCDFCRAIHAEMSAPAPMAGLPRKSGSWRNLGDDRAER